LEYFKKAMEAGHLFGHVQYARLLILGQKGFGGFFLGFYELFRGLYKTAKYAAKHSPEEIRPKISR
jgi:hypothetical protein